MGNFVIQVTNYDNNTGLPLVHMWNMVGEEVKLFNLILFNKLLVRRKEKFFFSVHNFLSILF